MHQSAGVRCMSVCLLSVDMLVVVEETNKTKQNRIKQNKNKVKTRIISYILSRPTRKSIVSGFVIFVSFRSIRKVACNGR